MRRKKELNLDGRVALVTGASRGIGRAIAKRLAAEGVHIAAGYRNSRDKADRLVEELQKGGVRAVAVGGDVGDPEALERIVDDAESALGLIDILVSNAGSVQQSSLEDLDQKMWDATLAEHLRAAFLLSKRLTPGMKDRRWGRVIFMSSVAAFTGGVVGPHYAAAKAGMIGMMHWMAASLAPHGVTVNVVAPALIESEVVRSVRGKARRQLMGMIPVGRFGRPEEVADFVLELVRNSYITGQSFSIDGGMHPR